MITPETPPLRDQMTAGTGRSMRRTAGRAYRDLVPLMSSHDGRDVTEPPRCGVLQYPTRTLFDPRWRWPSRASSHPSPSTQGVPSNVRASLLP
jgi:hypothetical protein